MDAKCRSSEACIRMAKGSGVEDEDENRRD